MTSEQERVISKIKALLSKTTNRGATEAESISAAIKAGELLQAFNLTLDQVYLDTQQCRQLEVNTEYFRRVPIFSVLGNIASFCGCKHFIRLRHKQTIQIVFFGLESDTDICKYLYEIVDQALETETLNFKKGDIYLYGNSRKTLTVNFQKGMMDRLRNRLSEMEQQNKKEQDIFASTGTSIILVKNAKVEEEYKKLEKALKMRHLPHSESRYNHSAYRAGHSAGENVNLNRPLSSSKQLQLT